MKVQKEDTQGETFTGTLDAAFQDASGDIVLIGRKKLHSGKLVTMKKVKIGLFFIIQNNLKTISGTLSVQTETCTQVKK